MFVIHLMIVIIVILMMVDIKMIIVNYVKIIIIQIKLKVPMTLLIASIHSALISGDDANTVYLIS
jgi:hypothetical protein